MRTGSRRRPAIDERRLHDAEARVAELTAEVALLRQAVDGLEPAVVICDEAGTVVLRNRRSLDLESSRPTGALISAAVDELLRTVRDQSPTSRIVELHGPPPRALVITAVPLLDGGRRIGTVAEIDDISERRRLEAVRRDFVANVSHELRTPIGALGLLAETLTKEREADVTARLCDRISVEVERAGRLIGDLLDLSRIEAEAAVEREWVAIDSVVKGAVDRVRPLAARRCVNIVEPVGDHALGVYGDGSQLVSAVANLLENAIKYSETASTVTVDTSSDGTTARIAIRDTGIGIPARDIERIFERFYRVDRARSRETGGTGLGLAIVGHIATNHGGTVGVESREGEGSVFTLELPLTAEPAR